MIFLCEETSVKENIRLIKRTQENLKIFITMDIQVLTVKKSYNSEAELIQDLDRN